MNEITPLDDQTIDPETASEEARQEQQRSVLENAPVNEGPHAPSGASGAGATPAERIVSAGDRLLSSRSGGLILVLLGIVLLAGRMLGFSLAHYLWPLFILVPGLILLSISFNMEGPAGEPFSIIGSIISMLGLMFFVMSATNLWASWAYAWALLFPTSIGIGQILYGMHAHQDPLVKTGKSLVIIGLSIFGVGFVFFEAILHINNLKAIEFCLPVVLIALGGMMFWRAMRSPRN